MKHSSTMLAGVTLLTLVSTQASAGCLEEIASLSPGTTTSSDPSTTAGLPSGRVTKDGSQAPLQSSANTTTQNTGTSSTGQTASTSPGQGIAKDGSTMPLANKPGEGSTTVATSPQDAQAQQRGGQTAAAGGQSQAPANQASTYNSPQVMAALDRARMLVQRGDEAGCMQAVQEAKRLRQ